MGNLNFFKNTAFSWHINYEKFTCPFCGTINDINIEHCKKCNNDLIDIQQRYYLYYNLYNEAYDCVVKKQYCSALEKISCFLLIYPKDKNANRLYYLILYKLKDSEFNNKIDQYISVSSDRLAAEFQDDKRKMKISSLEKKEPFVHNSKKCNHEILVFETYKKDLSSVKKTINLVNSMYALYVTCKKKKRKTKFEKQFLDFYMMVFVKDLNKKHIQVIDLIYKNYTSIEASVQECCDIENVIYTNKYSDNSVINVFQPGVVYKGLLIQRAKIELSKSRKKNG